MSDVDVDFPAAKLLDRLGPAVARLVLLKRFSHSDAIRFSNGQFEDDRLARYIEVAFAEDPLTDEYYVRPELDGALLEAMEATFPRAPQDLTRLLLTDRVGEEVLEPEELLRWIVRERLSPVAHATVAGMAIYGELEIDPAIRRLLSDAAFGSLMATILKPYAIPARRWLVAARPLHRGGAVDVLAELPESLVFRPRRPRSAVALNDGMQPQRCEIVRPRRTKDTVQLKMTPLSPVALPGKTDLLQLPGTEAGRFTTDVPLSSSTKDLLRLVMQDRGQAQITDRIHLDLSQQRIQRTASVSIAATSTVEETAFVHLGTIPRSVGNALARTAIVDSEQLTWGGGAIVGRYLQEVTALLTEQAMRPRGSMALPASDWYRLERSVREPWRFLSTNRTYIHFGVVELTWTTKLAPEDHVRPFELWPFDGASVSTVSTEGFRFGSDDGYNVDVECVDTSAIISASIDSVTRSPEMPVLERPSRIRTFLTWPFAIYRTVLVSVMICALTLIGTGIEGEQASQLDYADINVSLSVLSLVTGPVVAYLTASQFSRHGSRVAYIRQYGRIALAVAATVTLVVVTLLASRHSIARDLFSVVDICVGAYLGLATLFSAGSRIAPTWRMRQRLAASALRVAGRQRGPLRRTAR